MKINVIRGHGTVLQRRLHKVDGVVKLPEFIIQTGQFVIQFSTGGVSLQGKTYELTGFFEFSPGEIIMKDLIYLHQVDKIHFMVSNAVFEILCTPPGFLLFKLVMIEEFMHIRFLV